MLKRGLRAIVVVVILVSGFYLSSQAYAEVKMLDKGFTSTREDHGKRIVLQVDRSLLKGGVYHDVLQLVPNGLYRIEIDGTCVETKGASPEGRMGIVNEKGKKVVLTLTGEEGCR